MHTSRQNTRIPNQVTNVPDPPIVFARNVDFQPSKICPRNFIIFDRTDNRSQVMYHPALASGFGYSNGNGAKDNMLMRNDVNDPLEVMKEDSADIDLLLSFEEEDDYDEDEISTARTHGYDTRDTADSCSSRRVRDSRLGLSLGSHKSSGSSERKREKMRKMVNSLRGMVPGGNRLNTVGVLDEAVKYLESLKVELQNVGGGSLKI